MDIKSFRIKNYRSIKDSGECFLSGDNITILAGKNESGKTAILEALEDFNTEKKIREEAIPIHDKDVFPEITITFELDNAILKEISNEINYRLKSSKSININMAHVPKLSESMRSNQSSPSFNSNARKSR